MACNKTPGNDGLTSEFHFVFWPELKNPLLLFYVKLLRHKQQAIIELIEKKYR